MRFIALLLLVVTTSAHAQWENAVARMPLPQNAPLLNRSNALPILLRAFQSNDLVKAFVILPGVADDFFLVNKGAPLDIRTDNLLDALAALTNRSGLRLIFRRPFLLLAAETDWIGTRVRIEHQKTAAQLQFAMLRPRLLCLDEHWRNLQPRLEAGLHIRIRPKADSEDAWHFGRHYLAAWNLSGLETLEAVALADGTCYTVKRKRVVFEGAAEQ